MRSLKCLVISFTILIATWSQPAFAYPPGKSCLADAGWITNPSIPSEVPNGANADLCDFDKFSWQTFLAIIQPTGKGLAEFETWMPVYGVFENGKVKAKPTPWGEAPPIPAGACDGSVPSNPNFFSNLNLQAGSAHPLKDQKGNYVYYNVRMNKTFYDFAVGCGLEDVKGNSSCAKPVGGSVPKRFPGGAFDIKTAWKVLTPGEQSSGSYFTTSGVIKDRDTGKCRTQTMGLIGFHLVTATPLHPEFLWASFEHVNNAPDCSNPQSPPPAGWSFNNSSCPNCMNNHYKKGQPTQVCTVSPQGGGNATNKRNIRELNITVHWLLQQINPKGPGTISSAWRNYMMAGNIWTNGGVAPSPSKEQRGSLEFSSNVMETYTQTPPPPPPQSFYAKNCFSCHSYTSKDPSTFSSHITMIE